MAVPIKTFEHPNQNPNPLVALLGAMAQQKQQEQKRKDNMMLALAQKGLLRPSPEGEPGAYQYGGMNMSYNPVAGKSPWDAMKSQADAVKAMKQAQTYGQPTAKDIWQQGMGVAQAGATNMPMHLASLSPKKRTEFAQSLGQGYRDLVQGMGLGMGGMSMPAYMTGDPNIGDVTGRGQSRGQSGNNEIVSFMTPSGEGFDIPRNHPKFDELKKRIQTKYKGWIANGGKQ